MFAHVAAVQMQLSLNHADYLVIRATWRCRSGCQKSKGAYPAKGVLRNMGITKIRMAAALLVLIAVMASGAGIAVHRAAAADHDAEHRQQFTPASPPVFVGQNTLPLDKLAGHEVQAKTTTGTKPDAASDPQRFHIACNVTHICANGEMRLVAQSEMWTREGQVAGGIFSLQWGQGCPIPLTAIHQDDFSHFTTLYWWDCSSNTLAAVPGFKDGNDEYLAVGILIQVKVTCREDGRLRVDIDSEIKEPTIQDKECAVFNGLTVRCIKVVDSGETVRFELANGAAGERWHVEVAVRDRQDGSTTVMPSPSEENGSPSTPPKK
jgi:hypothetical protein